MEGANVCFLIMARFPVSEQRALALKFINTA